MNDKPDLHKPKHLIHEMGWTVVSASLRKRDEVLPEYGRWLTGQTAAKALWADRVLYPELWSEMAARKGRW